VITTYRIVRREYAENAFSGRSGLQFAARWNVAGVRIVYTAQSLALAVLEVLVHMRRAAGNLPSFLMAECTFPDALVEVLDCRRLPEHWADTPPAPEVQQLGMEWLTSGRSAVLAVPSAIIPTEMNYLLNPEHDDFRSIELGVPHPFSLDGRLVN
jgi:RES domain-containing protein